MRFVIKKPGVLSNKEALLILRTDLKKSASEVFTLHGLMKSLGLISNIRDLKRDSNLTILA